MPTSRESASQRQANPTTQEQIRAHRTALECCGTPHDMLSTTDATGADDAQGNLPAVGDENRIEGETLARLSC
ncbi:MAG TPA: hypothetical protein VJR48_09330 [Ktedonobacterales bacterium]|nr:hypothetical protein [Ktedonobacterales bacterium]